MNKYEIFRDMIENAQNIAIFTHINTDGDAIGSSFGFYTILKKLGKNVDLYCDSLIPTMIEFLEVEKILNKKTISENYDLSMVFDCNDSTRIGSYEKLFYESKKSIQVDHHENNPNFATLNFVSPESSSTCEVLYNIITEVGFEMNDFSSKCLLTGLITDTGGFRFSCTSKSTLMTAYNILDNSTINLSEIMSLIYESNTQENFLTYKHAVENTTFYDDDKIALIVVDNEFLVKNKLNGNATKNLTKIGTELKKTIVTISIVENKKGEFQISFRSRKGYNVAECASVFGGGGHKEAAGCRLYGNIETIKEKVLKAVRDGII